ncbi:MAG: flavodoxin-dependent (E)-4-hydroxy-3-methylbut-2-enyl-diphosphate synthase, partial [Phycisphaerae bacterium]
MADIVRRSSVAVQVGSVKVGGGHPIVVQSMTNTDTADVTGTLPLANGGTNASLTASNGGIFYSTGSAGAILAGTATAGQILRSGAASAPSWSTATYPATAGSSNNALVSDGTNFVSSAIVNSITGTSNQVTASSSTGAITLSLPQ